MKRGAALPYVRTAHRLLPTGTVYDFVPLQPRAPATIATLLTGGAVDGEIRVLPARERPTRPLAVPRVVHQTFRCWSAVPPAARMAMATWAERNPTWEVRVCAGGGCMEVAGVKG